MAKNKIKFSRSHKNNPYPKKANKKMLSFFALGFPQIIVAAIGAFISTSIVLSVIIILLTFYALVMLKQYLDSYYEDFDESEED